MKPRHFLLLNSLILAISLASFFLIVLLSDPQSASYFISTLLLAALFIAMASFIALVNFQVRKYKVYPPLSEKVMSESVYRGVLWAAALIVSIISYQYNFWVGIIAAILIVIVIEIFAIKNIAK